VASYELELRETDLGDVAVVALAGELDLTNSAELERRIADIAHGSSGLVLDLNRVLFLDSAALHVLFRVARRFDDEQKRFAIVLQPSAVVSRTLEIVGLDQAARVGPTLDDVLGEPGL
jgi:anti-anti-sigma factor